MLYYGRCVTQRWGFKQREGVLGVVPMAVGFLWSCGAAAAIAGAPLCLVRGAIQCGTVFTANQVIVIYWTLPFSIYWVPAAAGLSLMALDVTDDSIPFCTLHKMCPAATTQHNTHLKTG